MPEPAPNMAVTCHSPWLGRAHAITDATGPHASLDSDIAPDNILQTARNLCYQSNASCKQSRRNDPSAARYATQCYQAARAASHSNFPHRIAAFTMCQVSPSNQETLQGHAASWCTRRALQCCSGSLRTHPNSPHCRWCTCPHITGITRWDRMNLVTKGRPTSANGRPTHRSDIPARSAE